jgi:hypothetical protein
VSEIAEEREEASEMVVWEASWRVSVETLILFP